MRVSIVANVLALIASGVLLSSLFASEAASGSYHLAHGQEPAEVTVWNRVVATFRVGITHPTPAARAAKVSARLAALSDDVLAAELRVTPATLPGLDGVLFFAGDDLLFGLAQQDLDTLHGETLATASAHTLDLLHELFAAHREQRRPGLLLAGAAWSALALLVLLVALLFLHVGHRRLQRRITALTLSGLPQVGGFDLRPVVIAIVRLVVRLPILALALFAIYGFVTFALSRFPFTQPWADTLGQHLIDLAATCARAVAHAIPDLLVLIVIVFATRAVVRIAGAFFSGVEQGSLDVAWLQPESARATRRIVTVMIWLFAVTIAYPYIPGSGSAAFQGISVFTGLLLTLGSAGMVNQVMSGLVVLYSRTMRTGDLIEVNGVTGTVSELGFLATKLRTNRNEEISIPNAVLVGNQVTNLSRPEPGRHPLICTTITIGYDTPWRQVHALLALAAARTPGVVSEHQPLVLQRALSDFYVQYELRCAITDTMQRVPMLSALHAAIQDAFNEHGVQILSPHFEGQPDGVVTVAPTDWHRAPAVSG